MASFWKPEACGQTVLPDRSILLGQKLLENAKIQKFKWDILEDFQTLWVVMSDDHMCKVVKRGGSSGNTINYLFRCWEQTKILNSIFGIEKLKL